MYLSSLCLMSGHFKGDLAPTSGDLHFPSWDSLTLPKLQVSRDSGIGIKTLALAPASRGGLIVPLQSILSHLLIQVEWRRALGAHLLSQECPHSLAGADS